jgi:hypothetical protein
VDVAIVTGADSGFFEHLFEWVRSIRDKPQGRGVSLCIFDMGLSDQHKDWLLVQGAAIRKVQWRYQCNLSPTDRLLGPVFS